MGREDCVDDQISDTLKVKETGDVEGLDDRKRAPVNQKQELRKGKTDSQYDHIALPVRDEPNPRPPPTTRIPRLYQLNPI